MHLIISHAEVGWYVGGWMLGSLSSLDAAADGSYVTHLNQSIHAHSLDAHVFLSQPCSNRASVKVLQLLVSLGKARLSPLQRNKSNDED